MNEKNKKMELLGSTPVPRALLALGFPTMIGMMINALYNLVDAYFVGGLGSQPNGGDHHRLSSGPGRCGAGASVRKRRSSYLSLPYWDAETKKQPTRLPVPLYTAASLSEPQSSYVPCFSFTRSSDSWEPRKASCRTP